MAAYFGAFSIQSGLFVMVIALFLTVKSDGGCDMQLENTLRTLLTPQRYPSIQLQALRRSVLRKFQEALRKVDENDEKSLEEKKSLSSLAQWDNLPADKRNLEALARAGYIRTLPTYDHDSIDPNFKRSIANLAKNGQLPTTYNINESKRGIESLARNGELLHRNAKQIQQLLDDYAYDQNEAYDKRNFGFPLYYGKRNVAALARDGVRTSGKRNVAALLRQDSYLNGDRGGMTADGHTERPENPNDKRNIGSIKAQFPRSKRQAEFYEDEIPDEYEELLGALGYPLAPEKRFLGSVAKTGWFRPSSASSSRFNRYYQPPEKRHIGALARLGWLPSLRSIRRFNRSGRSTELDCRATSANGKAEDYSVAEDSLPLDDKRFLLQPAVDNILLRKILIQPKTHHPLVTGYSSLLS